MVRIAKRVSNHEAPPVAYILRDARSAGSSGWGVGALVGAGKEVVDARVKPGHDEGKGSAAR
jgi:hypothetical protein